MRQLVTVELSLSGHAGRLKRVGPRGSRTRREARGTCAVWMLARRLSLTMQFGERLPERGDVLGRMPDVSAGVTGRKQPISAEEPRLAPLSQALDGAKLLLLVLVADAITEDSQPVVHLEGAQSGPGGGLEAARARGRGFRARARGVSAVPAIAFPA
jgi:hypothetical protein